MQWQLSGSRLSRRAMLGATAVLTAGPALADECRLGPVPHEKGARVFMDMDQQELDASYNQLAYEPLLTQITMRLASNSEAMRARIGAPERESYGPSDWQKEFGLPPDIIKGGLCMSGMYEMKPVALSARRNYVKFTDAMEDSMSAIRHIDQLHSPITVTYGTFETPDFQRQSREFAAAVKAAGKPVQLIEAPNYAHLEMCESLGNPYGANGRAALEMMKLT